MLGKTRCGLNRQRWNMFKTEKSATHWKNYCTSLKVHKTIDDDDDDDDDDDNDDDNDDDYYYFISLKKRIRVGYTKIAFQLQLFNLILPGM